MQLPTINNSQAVEGSMTLGPLSGVLLQAVDE